MKKYLLIATVTLGLALTACGGGSKTGSAQSTNDTIPAVAAPVAPTDSAAVTVNQDSLLSQYETLINQGLDLQGKLQKGDASVAQDLAKVTDQMTTVATALQNVVAKLTPEQTQKLSDLAQKWAAAAPKAAK